MSKNTRTSGMRLVINFTISLVYLTSFSLFGQDTDTYFSFLKQLQYEKAKSTLQHWENPREKEALQYLADLMFYGGQQPVAHIKIAPQTRFEEALFHLTQGYRHLYYTLNKSDAFKDFYAAHEIALETKDAPLIKATLIAIFEYYHFEFLHNSKQFQIYLREYKKLTLDTVDTVILDLYSLIFLSQTLETPGVAYFKLAENLDIHLKEISKESRLIPRIYYEKAVNLQMRKIMDSAATYFESAFDAAGTYPFLQNIRFTSKIKLSDIEYQQKNYQRALDLINQAKDYYDRSDTIRSNLFLSRYSALYYAGLQKYDSAYFNFKKSTEAEYKLDYRRNTLEINGLNVVLQTQQKELENNKLKQNRIWFYVAMSILGLLLLLSYLSYKNIGAKKKIVEKEKEVQAQKMEKLLKEQELLGIDAMIEGQEKERRRIANDLHDNLGSILATLKMRFQHLRMKGAAGGNEQKLQLENTDELLEEAYQKVRGMAHASNAGVHAQEGLLPGVKNFATKVSLSNRLAITVIDQRMNERLENSLEITLFRIIQELITNIIKHAQATEATIHLTQHEDAINIMVEDNGKGFEVLELRPTAGMGLYSIQKRIENLKGELTIESVKEKGTTVIIDIPIP